MKIDKADLAKLKKKMQKRIAAELDVPIRKTRHISSAKASKLKHLQALIDEPVTEAGTEEWEQINQVLKSSPLSFEYFDGEHHQKRRS